MNLEKIFASKLMNATLVSSLTAMEWLGSKLGPYYAQKRKVSVERDHRVPTWDGHEVTVDIYTPQTAKPEAGWPVALVIHGGGWRFFSKDSHALIAAQIAELGYLTIATDYRLAPKHPFPHGMIDVCSVYDWIHAQAQHLQLDLRHVAVAGESAGASFALAISLLASGLASPRDLFRPEFENKRLDWAVPKKAVLHCGYHQVSGVTRYDTKLSTLVRCRIRMIQKNYLPQSLSDTSRKHWGLADPLCLLEEFIEAGKQISSEFPEVFIPVGERDPVLDDSVRLARVFEKLRLKPWLEVYPRAPHSFYAMPWNDQYHKCWADIRKFLAVR